MISAIVLACAVVQQRAEVFQADFDVIVLAHPQTTVDWDDIAARADRDSLKELAADHEWYVVESDVAMTVVDRRLLDLHQLAAQVELSSQLAQLGPERTGRISMQQLDESSRADLLLALAHSRPDWWPLFVRDDLELRFLPKAGIVIETDSGKRIHYLELPMNLEPVPRYSTEFKTDAAVARETLKTIGRAGSVESFPSQFTVRVMRTVSKDRWSGVPDAIDAVRAEYQRLASQHSAHMEKYTRDHMDGAMFDGLKNAKRGSDLPNSLFGTLSNSIEVRRSMFGVPASQDTDTWLLNVNFSEIRIRLFAEFGYLNQFGSKVRVSMGLPRGRGEP